jgi:hypothetical protein
MDQKYIDESFKCFANNAEPGSYMILVQCKSGDYFTGAKFADDCGPSTDRELVAAKRMDGSIIYFGRFKDHDNQTDN